jgi:hypothetical protein
VLPHRCPAPSQTHIVDYLAPESSLEAQPAYPNAQSESLERA